MHWESWTVSIAYQQSLKRPGVLQAGHQALMQHGTRVVSHAVEPAKKPGVSKTNTIFSRSEAATILATVRERPLFESAAYYSHP